MKISDVLGNNLCEAEKRFTPVFESSGRYG
jgi:hypothetical protein